MGNSITDLFSINVPIIQAPMAGVSTPELAAAVSNAGGLGSISVGASTNEQALQMIEAVRTRTEKPYNVNVFCHQPAQRDYVIESAWLKHLSPLFQELGADVPIALNEIYKSFLENEALFKLLLALKPPIISFHFGIPPQNWLSEFRAVGIKTIATATNLNEARLIENSGIDAIVAQGFEAGGHRGMFNPAVKDDTLTTSGLVQLLAKKIGIPLIAAGGIMNGSGIKAAFDIGASGVQLGTAFILCPESAANKNYRTALKSDKAYHTQMSSVISGRPARGMANRLVHYCSTEECPELPAYPIAYDASKNLNTIASMSGNDGFAVQWAGQGAPLARELPASQLMKVLMEEMVL